MIAEAPLAQSGRLLLVEHDSAEARNILGALSDVAPFELEIEFATSLEQAEAVMAVMPVDLVLLDLDLPGTTPQEALSRLCIGNQSVIVLAPVSQEDRALDAVSRGAHDYVLKGSLRRSELGRSIRYALERQRLLNATATREEHLDAAVEAQKMWVVGRLAASVAHEFNNLLTGLMGDAELLRRAAGPQEPVRSYADSLADGLQRAALLTRQLVSFSRKQVLQPRVLDLARVVNRIRPALERLLPDGVELVVEAEGGRALVKADPAQVEQLLLNLVGNAADAIDGVGTVRIRTTVGRRGVKNWALLVVQDDGVGMESRTVSRIFEPFFTTKEKTDRVGLGLSTVSHIVERAHGELDVRSQPGEGTEFRILLPSAPAEDLEETLEIDLAAVGPLPAARVLVVDDEEVVRRLVERVLSDAGYEVTAAADGTEALAVARRMGGIDLLVTDVIMPHLNGRELAEEIRAMHPELRTVFMSGYDEEILAPDGVLQEGVNFLAKPFHLRDVLRLVHKALQDD